MKGKAILRPLEMSDLDNMMTWVNNLEVVGYFANMNHNISREEEERFLENILQSPKDIMYAIETEEGEYLGNSGLNQIYWPSRNARLSIIIGNKEQQGRGYGQSAITQTLDLAFNTNNLHKVWLMVRESNEKARHVYGKCGFREEGVMREEYLLNGRFENMVRMSILDHEFKGRE